MSLLPTCKDVTRLVSDAMDKDLPWTQRAGLRLHLMMCSICRRFARQMSLTRQAVRQAGEMQPKDPAPSLSEETKERLKRALEE